MTINKVVSIVVPVYNQEQYLDISIPSLLNQSYKQLEIVVVDDGSTDCSIDIIKKYSKSDDRIKVIEKNNGGLVDATVVGIENSTGDYVCFVDPDDYVGSDFIENFIREMDDNYDFIAAGYLKNKKGTFIPYFLKENRVYNLEELSYFCNNFLLDKTNATVSNQFFISRWNKIYKRECVLNVVKQFKRFKKISLGEDTLFTYLILLNSKKAKTIRSLNSYYYNIGNQNSMMKNGAVQEHLKKSLLAFNSFKSLLSENSNDISQAYFLYYFLIDSIFQRTIRNDISEFKKLYKLIKNDSTYSETLDIIFKYKLAKKKKYGLLLRKKIMFSQLYIGINYIYYYVKKIYKLLIRELPKVVSDMKTKGIYKAFYEFKFRKNRENAFKDLEKKLPIIEKRVLPLLEPYLGKKTDFEKCTIERNVFLFWWDGFEDAPLIVKKCMMSVKKNYTDSNIIKITKFNYKEYTDINPLIIKDFEKGKISIQSFSDVLRFNLLKNNGGVWIDATIFFVDKFDLIDGLEKKSFESVEFSSSKNFLNYKNNYCSWSGYFIAARKNSVIINAINDIFEQYYLKYHSYSIYFFMDAIFMLCKIYNIDDQVLNKVQKNKNDMFLLSKILEQTYDENSMKLVRAIPQKLKWFYEVVDENLDSFYHRVVINDNISFDKKIK